VIRRATVIEWSRVPDFSDAKNGGIPPLSTFLAGQPPQKCKTVLTGWDVGHRSHSTDAVLFTEAAAVTEILAQRPPREKGERRSVDFCRSLTLLV